jgi:hypothetical protein
MSESISKPKALTPLWIISLFFSFTEIVLGYAVFNTTGGIQIALTCFVIIYPMLIAICFFWILIHYPGHIYAPADFENNKFFIESISASRKAREGLLTLDSEIEKRINKALTSDQIVKQLSSLKDESMREALQTISNNITTQIREDNFFSISLTTFLGKEKELTFPFNGFANFNDLTDEIFFLSEGSMEPYTYGTTWVLKDESTGKLIKHARMISGLGPGKPVKDNRTLEEVGITPGSTLEVVPIHQASSQQIGLIDKSPKLNKSTIRSTSR